MERTDTPDALQLLHEQHVEVEQMFGRLEGMQVAQLEDRREGLRDARTKLTNTIVTELSRHAAIEELHFYPAVRESLPDGDPLADHARDQHQVAKELLDRIDGMSPDSVDFDGLVRAVMVEVREHVRYEEDEMFPKLRQRLGDDRLHEIGGRLAKAMSTAPTRPHPYAPVKPGLAQMTGVMDKVRDKLEHRKTEE